MLKKTITMFKRTTLVASMITVSACQSSDQSSSTPSSGSSAAKAGSLRFDFSQTEVKTDTCLPAIKLKEIDTREISSIKAIAEMYDASGKNFNSFDIGIEVGHPLATVLFYPQAVTCNDLSIKINIKECTSKANNQKIQCPGINSKGTGSIKEVSFNE